MNLVVDFGNTRIKVALFTGNTLAEKKFFSTKNELLAALSSLPGIERCVVGSVTGPHPELIEQLSARFPTLLFQAGTPVPLTNLYQSANTLGSDRLGASVGAYTLYPNQHVLTIDAGTCIKYNFVTANNEYLGGAISPGLPMRLKAMHQFTHALPDVPVDKSYNQLIGRSSKESLLSGALIGAAAEVEGMVHYYQAQYPQLQVVLTGGDSDYLCKQLKNRFFTDPNILLYGLNAILNFNSEK